MQLSRQDGETKLQHHKRLVYGKLVDKSLADVDYTELAEEVYGQPYSSDVARRMMYGSERTLKLIEEEKINGVEDKTASEDLFAQKVELEKARQKYRDERRELNRMIREQARSEELRELLGDAIKNGNLPKLEYSPSPKLEGYNDLLVSLNDIHYGANVDNYWNLYNSNVTEQMMNDYLEKVIEISDRHQSENCVVWENGDSISGNIHYSLAVSNKENVIEQVVGVSELIANFLAELSKHFNVVRYVSVAGNHSRINPNKEESIKEERLDDLVEWYLAARLEKFQNIYIGDCDKLDSTMYVVSVRDCNYVGVHGDFDTTPTKVSELLAMLPRRFLPIYGVLSGHKHHCQIDDVNGVKTIMAGSFLGVDDFCVQKRIYGKAEQMVCVCNNDGIECSYLVKL